MSLKHEIKSLARKFCIFAKIFWNGTFRGRDRKFNAKGLWIKWLNFPIVKNDQQVILRQSVFLKLLKSIITKSTMKNCYGNLFLTVSMISIGKVSVSMSQTLSNTIRLIFFNSVTTFLTLATKLRAWNSKTSFNYLVMLYNLLFNLLI